MHGHLKFKKKIWIFQISIESAVLIIKNLINVNIKIQGLDGFVTHVSFSFEYIFFLCLNETSILKAQVLFPEFNRRQL